MCITPAEPLRYVAAELTLVFNEIGTVSFTCLFTTTDGNSGALTTNQFFLLEVGVIVTGLITSFPTTIVRFFAFETFIIGERGHRKLLQIIIVDISNLFQSWFFIQLFELCSLHCFFNYLFLDLNPFLDFFFKGRTLFGRHTLLAIWAVDVIEYYTRTIVSVLNNFLKAVDVENMSTAELDAWFLAKTWAVTDRTEFIFVNGWFHISLHFCYTFRFKAWHALFFSSWSKTWMSTRQYFIARFLHQVEAFSFSTNISECWFHTWWRLCEFFLTKSATFGISLSADFTQVIWLGITWGTEVFFAYMASNSIVCHMLSSFKTYWVSSFIFETFLYFTWLKLHNVSTRAAYEIWVQFNNLHFLLLLYFCLLIWSEIFIELILLHNCLTSCTFNIFILR